LRSEMSMSPFGRKARLHGCHSPVTMMVVWIGVGAAFFLPCGCPCAGGGKRLTAVNVHSVTSRQGMPTRSAQNLIGIETITATFEIATRFWEMEPTSGLTRLARTYNWLMLTEDDVVDAVCAHLVHEGYDIISKCTTNQTGIDIVAEDKSGGQLLIEAKGETSADCKSRRYGRPFDSAQVRDHVANAVYTALCLLERGSSVALAFPDNEAHRRRAFAVQAVLGKLGIRIYLVGPDLRVNIL
jgi:hypothetical protein